MAADADGREDLLAAFPANDLLSAVLDNTAGALFLMDAEGYPLYMNAAACRMTGYSGVQEIRHRHLHDSVHFRKPDGSPYPMSECPIDRANAEIRTLRDQREVFCRKDGSLFPVKYNVAPVERNGKRIGVVIEVRDVTEELAREREKARLLADAQGARDRLHALFMQAPAAVAIVDGPDHVWSFANPRYEALVGRRAEELIGRRVADVFPEVVEQGFLKLLDDVRATARPFHAQAMPLTLEQDGGPRRMYVNFVYQPVRDASDRVGSIMTHAVDVTQQVEAQHEIARLAEELEARVRERTAELSAAVRELESFGYTVSHDLRAPLRAVRYMAESALDEQGRALPPDVASNLRAIVHSTENMARLIEGILILSGVTGSELRREDVDLSALAEEVVQTLRRSHPERDVRVVIEPGLRARADPRLVRSVVENLLGNAWKFTREASPAEIEFASDPARPGSFVVRDNGVGFDGARAGELFTPFHRLHGGEYDGTGIGLATVKRIVERHGGTIEARSEPGRGTTIGFQIPDDAPGESGQVEA